ncbi:MAG: RidA family protein [Candidatus Diapherotrites archaeon]|uniref:RidA family protein n=1 Tax=Candidatus Iainarchaeum sp. TaxID=3101447 RepID=A0A8T3YJY8_9ARCH|nr:RidA family protein [Candidatus Diapherotrites archaeon]
MPVESGRAPMPIGPYSQAIAAGAFVFVSGQIGIDASTGKLVEGGVLAQAERIFSNIAAILAAEGCTLRNVVKCELYLKDINDFKAVNEAYARHFSAEPRPARQAMQVAALPMGALIEVSCIAALKK